MERKVAIFIFCFVFISLSRGEKLPTKFRRFRSLITKNTQTGDAPLVGSDVTVSTKRSKEACLAVGLQSDLLRMESLDDGGVDCYEYSLNSQGQLRHFMDPAFAVIDGDSWINKPDFTWKRDANTVGGSLATGITGHSATAFNGFNDSISLGDQRDKCFGNLNLCPKGITYSFWIKILNEQGKANTSTSVFYISSGGQTTYSHGVVFISKDGEESWWFKTDTQWWKDAKFPMIVNRWHYITATWSQSEGIRVYVNGQFEASHIDVVADGHGGSYNEFVFGEPNTFSGVPDLFGEYILDDFKVYYFFMSDNDVKQLFLASYSN